MRTGKYELVIIWDDDAMQVLEFASEEAANKALNNYKTAFGNQVVWCGVRPQIAKGV